MAGEQATVPRGARDVESARAPQLLQPLTERVLVAFELRFPARVTTDFGEGSDVGRHPAQLQNFEHRGRFG